MKITKFIENVDNIIADKKEKERQNALFCTSATSSGLGFIGNVCDSNGNMSTIMGNNNGIFSTITMNGTTYYTSGF